MTALPYKPAHAARSAARLAAVQGLYQMELSGAGVDMVIAEFLDHRLQTVPREAVGSHDRGENDYGEIDLGEADRDFFVAIMKGSVAHQLDIDRRLHASLVKGWTLARLDATLRALLRAGAYELLNEKTIPVPVVINEYVNLAHAFFGGEEPGLVNAMLDRLAREVRTQSCGS
jgi:N utilization substance protein B